MQATRPASPTALLALSLATLLTLVGRGPSQQGPQAHALSPEPTVLGAGIAGGGTETDTADSAQLPRS